MACRGFWACLLKLLNLLMTLAGLAMVAYGIYLLVEYDRASEEIADSPSSYDQTVIQFGRPIFTAVSLSDSISLPKAWFIYLFIAIGVVLFVISCFGCIGIATRNGCCLCCYSILLLLLILVELGFAAFLYFDKSWEKEIPADKTGYFEMIYKFLRENWNIVKWVALGIVIFEALLFLLALIVRAANRPADYDSDDEFVNPRHQMRQPLINRTAGPAAGPPVPGAIDQRPPGRNDAWSTRMREKYGLDTSEFTYNPSESQRLQQGSSQPTEERKRCTIM
ncbi:tobamovirus multiplication protein 2A [Neltuma alba]|uniref:tobamovirus multiplication protein 2A n=1 Tax=Neltuma alba TaxID=207710 RepID=UPI0010A4C01B|nr:tobamovirus multiplication protein 2A-like [Prosopis alba]XP_028772866.1 tobamovirus multiplication protein 2A-like [Prosopis alba]